MSPEQLAELFHETYERLAPAFGWKTKKGCHCKFSELPQRNRALMIATCQTVLNALQNSGAVAEQHTTPQGQNGTAGKPQVGECTTSAIA